MSEQIVYCPTCCVKRSHIESIEDGAKVYCQHCGTHHNAVAGDIRVKIMLNFNDATHEKIAEMLELAKLLGAGSKELLRTDNAGNVYMDLSGELLVSRKEIQSLMAPLAPSGRSSRVKAV